MKFSAYARAAAWIALLTVIAPVNPARAQTGSSQADSNLVGRELSAHNDGSQELKGVLFDLLDVGERPAIHRLTVAAASPRVLRLQAVTRNFDGYTLLASILDENKFPNGHLPEVSLAVSDDTDPLTLNFDLSGDTPEGASFTTAYVLLVAQKFGRDIPGLQWRYPLQKYWQVPLAPERVVVRIRPEPEGAAASLSNRDPGVRPLPLPPLKTLEIEKLAPKYTIQHSTLSTATLNKATLNNTALRSTAASGSNRARDTANGAATNKPTAAANNALRLTSSSTALRNPSVDSAKLQLLTQKQKTILTNTDAVLAKLPAARTSGKITGIKPEDKDRGAQGPSAVSIDLLPAVNIDSDLPVNEILSVRREIYVDKNPQSGVLYYIPRAYHLRWDADEGYGMKMLYTANDNPAAAGRVLMAMRLSSGVSARDSQLVQELAEAYRQANSATFPIPVNRKLVVRPLPLTSEHPGVSLTDSLGSHFNIADDEVVATVVSDALAEMNVSWITDEVTKENIQLVLSQDIGIAGDVTYALDSDEVSQITIPANVRLADQDTFGMLEWQRGAEWRNPTPYPLRLKYLHALLLHNNQPLVYSWNLGSNEVPPQAKVEWDAARVPTWLDRKAKRLWVEYSVQQDCATCDNAVMRALTFGANRAASRQAVTFRTLTPLADLGAAEIHVRIRSRYFSSGGDALETLPVAILDQDRNELKVGDVYLVDRQAGEERPGDPLFQYQMELIMPDGTIHAATNNRWVDSQRERVLVGTVQVEQALGYLPATTAPTGDQE